VQWFPLIVHEVLQLRYGSSELRLGSRERSGTQSGLKLQGVTVKIQVPPWSAELGFPPMITFGRRVRIGAMEVSGLVMDPKCRARFSPTKVSQLSLLQGWWGCSEDDSCRIWIHSRASTGLRVVPRFCRKKLTTT